MQWVPLERRHRAFIILPCDGILAGKTKTFVAKVSIGEIVGANNNPFRSITPTVGTMTKAWVAESGPYDNRLYRLSSCGCKMTATLSFRYRRLRHHLVIWQLQSRHDEPEVEKTIVMLACSIRLMSSVNAARPWMIASCGLAAGDLPFGSFPSVGQNN